jgi:SAM-dependent methyltransferase
MEEAPPFDAWSLREAAEALLLVTAAMEAGVLAELERERTAAELAAACRLDPRATGICLGALEAIGVVERGARGYRLTGFGRSRFADPRSVSYVGTELPVWRMGLRGWLFLEEVLRTGRPLAEDGTPEGRARLYRALDVKPPGRVAAVVEATVARAPVACPRVLDVGGGTGAYARGFSERGCRVVLLERPEVVRHVREAFGLDRLAGLTLVEGDFRQALPEGPFEAVLMADVVHGLAGPAACELLERAGRVTGPGGVAAIVDLFRGRSRRAAFYALTLLLYGEEGDNTHAAGDVLEWLRTAEFGEARFSDLDGGRSLLTAVKARATSCRSG